MKPRLATHSGGCYTVVRVADEIAVDFMASASGIRYEEAIQDSIIRTIDGVAIQDVGVRGVLFPQRSQ